MDCRGFENCLDILEAGLLRPDQQAQAQEHLRICPRCSNLLALVTGKSDILAPQARDNLAFAILRQTSGAVCGDAEERLCAFVDGTLAADDREIMSHHLSHCSDCGGLAQTLAELTEHLPGMATLEPDARFTGDVLCATSHALWILPESRIKTWWRRMLQRPRFAWETAYVGTLLVLLAFGNATVLPMTDAVSQSLIDRSDRLLEGTAAALENHGTVVEHSLSDLCMRGRVLWENTAAFPAQSISTMRRQLVSTFEQLKSEYFDNTPVEKSRDGLR